MEGTVYLHVLYVRGDMFPWELSVVYCKNLRRAEADVGWKTAHQTTHSVTLCGVEQKTASYLKLRLVGLTETSILVDASFASYATEEKMEFDVPWPTYSRANNCSNFYHRLRFSVLRRTEIRKRHSPSWGAKLLQTSVFERDGRKT